MAEKTSEVCLRHPVAVKYVDIKWRKRGFKYTIGLILLTLIFHICLMIYTTRVIGVVNKRTELRRKYLYESHGGKFFRSVPCNSYNHRQINRFILDHTADRFDQVRLVSW